MTEQYRMNVGAVAIMAGTGKRRSALKRLLKERHIPEDCRIFPHAILRYPKGGFPEAKLHDIYASPVYY